jgi:hypothetical protein
MRLPTHEALNMLKGLYSAAAPADIRLRGDPICRVWLFLSPRAVKIEAVTIIDLLPGSGGVITVPG